MKSYLTGTLIAAAAAMLMVTSVQADEGAPSRAQVRAELAEARAAGMLDQPGEAGATETVLAAREAHNALQALVLQAQRDVDEQMLHAEPGQPDLAVYFEAGPHGPVMVLLTFDADGGLHSADTLALTMAQVR